MRRAALPQAPDAYELKLPGDFKPPEGVKFELKNDDPLWPQARAWAHKHGLSQEAFTEGLALVAGDRVGEVQRVATARAAEVAKLGPNGAARVTAVNTWLDAVGAGDLKGRMWTAGDVAAFEKIITRAASQGSGSFRQNGREPPEPPGRKSAEEIAKMSPAQKLDYARGFDQSQFQNGQAR